MTTIKAHFDGKAIIPDEPVELPQNTQLYVLVGNKRPMTGKDLLESGLVGLWEHRMDIGHSVEYARKLREQAQTRRRD